jgi:hypothetical protein
MKSDFEVLINKIKSMTEIISILNEELKHHSVTSQERKTVNSCTSKPSTNLLYCCKCSELDTQLIQDTLSELSLVKLITEILNEEIKVLKQTSYNDSITSNPWIDTRSKGPRGSSSVQPPEEAHTTHKIPVAYPYDLPVTNRYDVLSKRHESQEPRDAILPTKSMQTSKLVPDNTHEHVQGLCRKNLPAVNQHRRPRIHQWNKPNLQESSTNENGACFIPTIVNGVTNVNPISMTVQNKKKCSHSKCSHSKRHRIILIRDSIIKGYACNLKSLLSNNYDLYSIVKPGSTTSELKESAKDEVSQLTHDDVLVMCSGTNDCELNKFSLTFHNIMSFIKKNNHTNIILMNVPLRYDLPNSVTANKNISVLNRKLQKLVEVFPYMSFVKTVKDRNLYTYHGLHLNKLGKQLVYHQIASLLYSIFEQKTSHPIFLGWHEIQDVNNLTCDENQMHEIQDVNNLTCDENQMHEIQDGNNLTCDENQMHEIQDDNILTCDENQKQTSNRSLNRSRRPPVTRSNDFLWQI